MRDKFIRLRNAFSEWKIYFSRANSYVNLATALGVLWLSLSRLQQDYGLNITTKWALIIFPFLIILISVVGWLDSKLGFYRQEAKRVADRNPYFSEIKDYVKKINERLDDIESSIHKSDKVDKKTSG